MLCNRVPSILKILEFEKTGFTVKDDSFMSKNVYLVGLKISNYKKIVKTTNLGIEKSN